MRRERERADERRVLLRLTGAGRALKSRAAKVPPRMVCATACDLDELNALTARLKTLRDRLSAAVAA